MRRDKRSSVVSNNPAEPLPRPNSCRGRLARPARRSSAVASCVDGGNDYALHVYGLLLCCDYCEVELLK
jgi:hypothetical protein